MYSETQLSWSLINHMNCTPFYLKGCFYVEHLIISWSIRLETEPCVEDLR